MATTQRGSAYVYDLDSTDATAIATAFGMEPTDVSTDHTPEFVQRGTNRAGNVASVLIADDMRKISITGKITNLSTYKSGTTVTLDSKFCYVIDKKEPRKGGDFLIGQVDLEHYTNVTS